jgi:hypothetical protein
MTVAVEEREHSSRPWWARLAAASGIATILVLTGFLYVATRPGAVALALRLAPGRTVRYRTSMTMNGSVANESESAPYRLQVAEVVAWRIRSVDARGIATVDLSVEDGTVTVNGRARPSPTAAPAAVVQVARDGRILAAQDPGLFPGRGAGAGFPGLDQLTPVLPLRPVAPGSSWSRVFDQAFPPGDGTLHYTAAGRFVRYEDTGGIRTVVVAGSLSVPIEVTVETNMVSGVQPSSTPPPPASGAAPTIGYSGTSSARQTAWVDAKAGTLVRVATVGTVDMTLSFHGFAPLFPTFDPGSGAGGIGLPFGGGPPGSSGGSAQETLRFRGTLSLQMQLLR